MNLHEIFDRVEKAWPFDEETYPSLPHEARKARVAYTSHVLVHLMKSTGKLAAAFEPPAHHLPERFIWQRVLERGVAKQAAYTIVNTIRLAQLVGVLAEEVEKEILTYLIENDA